MFIDFGVKYNESVKRKPSRTILTGIGISWGIFYPDSLGWNRFRFLNGGVFKLFNGFSKSTTYVYASETSMEYKGADSGRKIQFQKEDLNMLKSRIPEITHLSPETGRWNAVYAGTKNGWFEVRGVYPDYFLIKLLEVEHGRMLNALDMNEARKVVLIGENVVDMLFRKENPNWQVYPYGAGDVPGDWNNKEYECLIRMRQESFICLTRSMNKLMPLPGGLAQLYSLQ